ncbi:MAG TPA: DegT/DnrJ/EryC1/StrS family aminotransferase [Anaerolineales bacterium]|nr:DegT/DnrJ/EryC1/StrS family aminotransferase [Anaerolineales bacterium]
MRKIPVAGPWITEKEIQYVNDAVANAWYGNANMYHERFEKAFAKYVGTKYAMALPTCTSAIHLSLLALGVGAEDEIIVPDATWIATSAPISYVGATSVFADIDPETWCLSAESFEACITPRTKAVIPVDLYGGMPDMDAIIRIARHRNIAIIEDAAEALGAEYKGKRAGGFGDTGVFSFHGSKTVTTGEGGMVVTDREDLYKRIQVLRDHGRQPGDRMFWNTEVAYKYKMSSMQAALGLAQLERIDELIERKRAQFDWYKQGLAGVDGITLNAEPAGTRNTFWMVTIVLDPKLGLNKVQLMESLSQYAMDTRPFFHPLSSIPAYEDSEQAHAARERNRVAYQVSPYAVNLPSALSLGRTDIQYVCDAVKEILKS